MIGKKQLVYGADQFMSGMASSDYGTDGVLSNTSAALNPFVTPGAMKGNLLASDQANNLADTPIASIEDGTGGLKARLFVGNAAKYYTVDTSGVIANVATGADTSNYTYGRTDIGMQSNSGGTGMAFVTHGTNVAAWNGSTTITESWYTTTAYLVGTTTRPTVLTSNPHPLLNFNSNLWIADGSQLHNIIPNVALIATNCACVNQSVFSLELNATIYALAIDPTTGLMLISFQTVQNQGDTVSTQAFVGLYDGYSTGLRRKIPVDDLVTSFQSVGGQVFCMFGPKVGYWNGNGITFLRKLQNVTNNTTSLIYKHRISNVGNILLIADGPTLVGYGEPAGGKQKAWFNLGASLGGTDVISCIGSLGNNQIAVFNFYTTGAINNLRTYSLSSALGTSFQLAFTKVFFERPIFLHTIRVFTTGIAHSGFTDLTATVLNEKDAAVPIAAGAVSVPTGTTYVQDFQYGGVKCLAIKPTLGMGNGTWGITRVIIYYDVAE